MNQSSVASIFCFSVIAFFLSGVTVNPAHAACNHKIDSKKYVLFIDTNAGLMEIEAAEAAACTRGERFVAYPYEASEISVYKKALDAQGLACGQLEYSDCGWRPSPNEKPQCEKFRRACNNAKQAFGLAEQNLRPMGNFGEGLKNKLKELAAEGAAPRSVVVSGHDGGGRFHGALGDVDRSYVATLLSGAYQAKPELLDQLESVFLWGCYTASPCEVARWKSKLPGLKVVGGFDGAGPSNTQPAGASYLRQVLEKESALSKTRSEKELLAAIQGVQGIQQTLSGLYVNHCNQESFYAQRDNNEGKREVVFSPLDQVVSCQQKARIVVNSHSDEIDQYRDGKLPIPENTASGALRKIYNDYRQNEQCLAEFHQPPPEQIGLLMFYRGVSENFVHTFEAEGRAAQTAINELDPQKILADLDKAQKDAVEKYKYYQDIRDHSNSNVVKELVKIDEQYQTDQLNKELVTFKASFNKSRKLSIFMTARPDTQPTEFAKLSGKKKTEVQRYWAVTDKLNKRDLDVETMRSKNRALYDEARNYLSRSISSDQEFLRDRTIIENKLQKVKTLWTATPENLAKVQDRSELRKNLSAMNEVIWGLSHVSQLDDQRNALSVYYTKMQSYLYNTDARCMDFLDWHEYVPGKKLSGKC